MISRRLSPPLIKQSLDSNLQFAPTSACPKCLGMGAIIVMRRSLGQDDIQTCGTCEGTGHIHRKAGFYDPVPNLLNESFRTS